MDKTCSTCRWQPTDWEPGLHNPTKATGNCRAPVPFWMNDAVTSLAAPLEAYVEDYRGLRRDAKGGIVGEWADDFPGCEAWQGK